MNCTLVIAQGNTPVLQAEVTDSATDSPVNTASVQVTISDGQGHPVAGQSWPAPLLYVPGSSGIYRAAFSPDSAFTVGQTYAAAFDITTAGGTAHFTYNLFVQAPGQYNPDIVAERPRAPTDRQRLSEAEDAYHQLTIGHGVAVIKDQNGEEVQYSITNRSALLQYIQMLRRRLGMPLSSFRPATVVFQERRYWWMRGRHDR